MNEIKCPHCGTVFTIDEADYASLVQQVRTTEFENELHARLSEAEKAKKAEIELAEARVTQHAQEVAAQKDAEIQRLRHQIEGAGSAQALAIAKAAEEAQRTLAERDAEILSLKAELDKAGTAHELAVTKAVSVVKEKLGD